MGIVLVAMGHSARLGLATPHTREMFLDRLNDTARFAAIAQQADAARSLDSIAPELRRYQAVYGIACAVLADGGTALLASSAQRLPSDDVSAERVSNALGGRRSEPPEAQWPCRSAGPPGVATGRRAGRRHQPGRNRRLDARVDSETGPPELRRLSASFNEMADHVQALLEQQRAFVADASHRLRNPLSALLLRLDDVAGRVPAALRADADHALDEGKRLAGTLQRLLELARAEHTVTSVRSCDVVAIVDERILAWRAIAEAGASTCAATVPIGWPPGRTRPRYLGRWTWCGLDVWIAPPRRPVSAWTADTTAATQDARTGSVAIAVRRSVTFTAGRTVAMAR